jgi:dipeptidyl aminopeptidase/acylaminoacyl peptidase
LDALFAPPTEEEIAQVEAEWAKIRQRVSTQSSTEWTVETTGTFPGGTKIQMVSHLVDGQRHYAAVRFPRIFREGGSYPVLLLDNTDTRGASIMNVMRFSQSIYTIGRCIVLVPSYRGATINGGFKFGTFTSEGTPGSIARDAQDASALLDVVLKNIPEADSNRIITLGMGRGAGVSLLTGIQDTRISAVVSVSGVTDCFLPSLRTRISASITNNASLTSPILDAVAKQIVTPYERQELTLSKARLELLRRSPLYFAASLPNIQIIHGDEDKTVSIKHAERLNQILADSNDPNRQIEYVPDPRGNHAPDLAADHGSRIDSFLRDIEGR